MQTEHIKVTGMTCGGCADKVMHALNATAGVSDANVLLSSGEATVRYDERSASPAQLKAAVKSAGYGVDMPSGGGDQQPKGCCCSQNRKL